MLHRIAAALAAFALAAPGLHAAAAAPEVVAVVACDPYADLKKQIRWVGTLVDQPTLDGFAESFIMIATQFKGLAGLDVARPAGVVVTAAGDAPVVHAFVPVKDLGKLLDALQGIVGPVEEAGGVRRISPPGGMPLDIVEKEGWAIIGPRGVAPPAVADPTEFFADVVGRFAVGVQAFPSRMPEGMRRRLQAMFDQAAAAQDQAAGPAAFAGMVENVAQTESLLVGLAIDMQEERVSLESQSRMPPGSKAAAASADAARAAVTVASPVMADGKPPAMSAHVAMAVPASGREAAIAALETIQAPAGSGAALETPVAILRAVIAAMIEAGGYDAAASIDTSVIAVGAKPPVPAVTAGMRVKDGPALEKRIKKLVADAGAVPGLKVTFDAGKAAGANLHTITLTAAGLLPGTAEGDVLDVTLAVAPSYVWLLAGGDVPARLAAVAAASGKPDPNVKPLADVTVAVGPLLRFAAAAARAADDAATDAAGLEAAAGVADAQKSALVQLLMRPVERGMSLRLSADAGAIRTVAASVRPQAGGPRRGRPRAPATGGPDPIPFPVPGLAP